MMHRVFVFRRSPAAALVAVVFLFAGCTVSQKQAAYEGGSRDEWQKPDEVVAMLNIAPGSTVADLGSGSGYFTARLARATGGDGKVYAVDVDAEMNEFLAERLRKEGVANVEIITAEADDAKLPPGAIDLLFTSNTYHHLPDPAVYFRHLKKALAPGGRVAILEYSDETGGLFVEWFGHSTGRAQIEKSLQEAGYRLESDADLSRQSFLVFAPD
jgi:arsenite methyltransferase